MTNDRDAIIQDITALMDESRKAMQAKFYRSIDKTGLRLSHAHLLLVISQKQPARLKDLADKMGLTPGAITQLSEQLFKDGYLSRTPHEHDRRSVLVSLTDKGTEVVAAMQNKLREHFTAMLTTLSDEELRVFLRAQQKMLASIEQEARKEQAS